MTTYCQVTGVRPMFGNRISHSHRRTPRRFDPNLQTRTFWVPSLRRSVRLTVSTRGLKVIDRRGIDAVVAGLLARGERV